MASLRQIIAQGRKRIGLLVGAGAPAGIFPPGSDKPLIPAVAGLTTNYDLLFEQALERTRIPFFDGFSGASEAFFDPSSLGWAANARGEVVRTGKASITLEVT